MLNECVQRLLRGERLDRASARGALEHVLGGDVAPAPIAALLALLQRDGPDPAEIAGFADALSAAAIPFPVPPGAGIDTCGTGGDGRSTFNVSTTAALVAAAAGARVFKHGNRAATSRSGSADLLEEWGVPIELEPAAAARSVERHGFAFLYARQYHPVLARLAPIRSSIGFPTIFNLLGPLLNPARVVRQVVGVYSERGQELVASALALRGVERVLVLHGALGLDEATPLGPFRVIAVHGHEREPAVLRDPAELGLARCRLEDLQASGPQESRAMAQSVIEGRKGACRDAVLLNAALALEVAGVAKDWREGYERAARAVDDGSVLRTLDALRLRSDGEGGVGP